MTTAPPTTSAARRLTWPVVATVVALLVFYVVMALSASLQKGQSYDEGEEIAIGYNIWRHRDFRMEAANGDLVKRWATLPLLITKPAAPGSTNPYWRAGGAYEVAYIFFFESGNDPRALLRQCRTMMAVLGVATGLLVFFCSRELFGNLGGLISLTLFVSSPSMLAFGGMVSTEMAVCFTMLGSVWSVWRLLHRVTWGRLLGSLVFLGLLLLSKPSAVVIFPVTAIMIVVKLWRGLPLAWCLGAQRSVRSRFSQVRIFGGLFVLHGLFGWTTIWAHYDFRYLASPNPADPGIVFKTQPQDPIDPSVVAFFTWSRRTHFLPEAYIHGVEWLMAQDESQASFMDGRWKYGGWRTFFPYAMWVKTQPALILLLGLSLVGWRRLSRPGESAGTAPDDPLSTSAAPALYGAVPFFALAGVYFSIAVTWDLNIGFRHALPIYPAGYVLAGALAFVWAARGLVLKTAIALLLAWHVSGPVEIYPHFLAYFSPVAGGPTQGYKRLVDSSLDWGMDLPGLKRWLDQNNPGDREPFFFAYFGVSSPDYYNIKSNRLPGRPDWRLIKPFPLGPGIYAISATLLQGIGRQTVGPWNKLFEKAYQRMLTDLHAFEATANNPAQRAALLEKYPQEFWNSEYAVFEQLRFGRLCAWLRHKRTPDAMVGYSILIWHLSADEIFEAGLGPPVELEEAPLHR
jgi:hypothetical protein